MSSEREERKIARFHVDFSIDNRELQKKKDAEKLVVFESQKEDDKQE